MRDKAGRLLFSALLLSGLIMICLVIEWHHRAFSRQASANLPVTEVDLSAKNGQVGITSWRVCGPFVLTAKDQHDSANTEAEVFAQDYLALAGARESPLKLPPVITHATINFDRDPSKEPKAPPSLDVFLNQRIAFPTTDVDTQLVYWGAYHVFKVVYAAANLASAADQDVIFVTEANSPVKVWINDVPQIQSGNGITSSLNFALKVHLHAGDNTLLIKEICFPLRNDFAVWIMTPLKAQQVIQEHNDFFKIPTQLIIPRGAPLTISPMMARIYGESPGPEGYFTIRDISGHIVQTGPLNAASNTNIRVFNLADGLYSINLSRGTMATGDLIFVGDFKKRLAIYSARCAVHFHLALPCDALPRLIKTSEDETSFHFDKQHLIVFLLAQFEWALHDIPPQKRSDGSAFDVRVVSFRSKIDRSIQHYYLYLPHHVPQGGRLPIVVALVPQPVASSSFFAPLGALESYARVGDRYHMGFIVPFARGEDGLTDLARNDILEALQDTESRLNLDRGRVYLAGECDGGRNALLMAEDYPDIFAAVSVRRPAIGEYLPQTYRGVDENNVFPRLRNLSTIPVRLVHSEIDFHSPLSQDIFFAQQAKLIGIKPDAKVLPGSGEFDLTDPDDTMFEFFAEIKGREKSVP